MIGSRSGKNRCTGCTSGCEDDSGSSSISSPAAVAEVVLFCWMQFLVCSFSSLVISIALSIFRTVCARRFVSFNISSLVVHCAVKSNSASLRMNPICSCGLAFWMFLFFFVCFASILVSISNNTTHFLEVFGGGCGHFMTIDVITSMM